jgi:chromosome segregation ATPase
MRLLAVFLVLGTAADTALAQSARNGGNANAQLMQQMQQLASERTALQAENARMKKELAELTKERDALQASRTVLDQRTRASEAAIARTTQEKATAEGEAAKLQERMQELVAKFRETAQTLRDVETERAAFRQSLATRDAELTQCIDRNRALYELNGEVLTRLENQGVWSRAAAREPFTQIKRTQLENLIEDYRYRAQDLSPTPGSN